MTTAHSKPGKPTSLDRHGLNAANFFLAELTGVILPFLGFYLKQKNWNYDLIGITLAMAGLGTLVFQIPAGVLSDKIWSRRLLLATMALTLGGCYVILPQMTHHVVIVGVLLFISGMADAFLVPLLSALALSLVGHKEFDTLMGINQSWRHGGNIFASLATLISIRFFGVTAVFYVVGGLSILSCLSLCFINSRHLNPDLSKERSAGMGTSSHVKATRHGPTKSLVQAMREQFSNPPAVILLLSNILFNVANAPAMSTVALYIKTIGGNDDMVAWAIIIGQTAMVPVSYFAAKYCGTRGRKPVMMVAFIALTVRIALYPLTTRPYIILVIQLLNGIDIGIYLVAISLICGDLTKGKEGFNTLLGIMQMAVAFGGVLGPAVQGFTTQHWGFPMTFFSFSAVAASGGVLFLLKMPETGKNLGKAAHQGK